MREIAAFDTDVELTDQAVAAYVAKYATKSADDAGTLDRALFCRRCQGRGAMLLPHGTPLPCTACNGTGQARPRPLPRLAVARYVLQMIRTCWELGKLPEFANLKLWKWAHMRGFRGHFSTKSRRSSITLGATPAAPGALNRPASTPACLTSTRRPPSSSATGPTTARVTAPVLDSWRPPSGTAENWNGSSRPKGAADVHTPAH